jgi:hypothetical protein
VKASRVPNATPSAATGAISKRDCGPSQAVSGYSADDIGAQQTGEFFRRSSKARGSAPFAAHRIIYFAEVERA